MPDPKNQKNRKVLIPKDLYNRVYDIIEARNRDLRHAGEDNRDTRHTFSSFVREALEAYVAWLEDWESPKGGETENES